MFYGIFFIGESTCLRVSRGGAFENLGQQLVEVLGVHPLSVPECTYLWFVRCLFVFVCLLPFFSWVRFRIGGVVLISALFFFYGARLHLYWPVSDWRIEAQMDGWVKGILFISAGIWLRWNGECVQRFASKIPSGIFCIVGVVLCAIESDVMHRLLAVPIIMIAYWRIVPGIALPKWVTSCSFPMYVLHLLFIMLLSRSLAVVGLADLKNSFATYCILIPLVMILCVGLTVAIRRCLPHFCQFLFGGR